MQLLGPCRWWRDAARVARYEFDGAHVPAVVILGPELAGDRAHAAAGEPNPEATTLARARQRARPWLRRRVTGVVTLLAVEVVDRRTAWVYEDCDGVSLGSLVAAGGVPQQIGPAVVAACAEVLEPIVAAGGAHPGLGADDVLVLRDGSVRLSGFVGPFAQAPAHREPRGAEDASAAVWRLGVLLAEILTGTLVAPATDRGGHELMLRRLYVRVMSRPGPMFPDRYRDWLGAMLAWDPVERPLLSRIAPGLRELAESLPPPDLRAFAGTRVAAVRSIRAIEAIPALDPPSEPADNATPSPVERTEEARWDLSDHPDHDDVTAVSYDGDPPLRVPPPPEPGTIPVHVGPPPEAIPRSGHLPTELFDGRSGAGTGTGTGTATATATATATDAVIRSWRRAWWVALLLAAVASLLVGYLLR